MKKSNFLLKVALVFGMILSFTGLARADELVATYKWNIQYNNAISFAANNPTADITVEVYNTGGSNHIIKETDATNILQGLTIPFTLQGNTATFPCENIGAVGSYQNVFFQNCYSQGGYYMPQMNSQTATFDVETGFTFKSAPQGFGWFVSSTSGSYTPDGAMNVVVAFFINSQEYVEPSTGDDDDDAEPIATYKWNIQYNNAISFATNNPTADITVEVYNTDGNNHIIKETDATNILQGLTIPFTLQGNTATFPCENIGAVGSYQNVFFQNCYSQGGYYMPQMNSQTAEFDVETGFTFKSAPQGFGWFVSSTSGSYTPDGAMNVVVAFFINSQEYVDPNGGGDTPVDPEPQPGDDYPALSEIAGTYPMTADVEYLVSGLETYFPTSANITIQGSKLTQFVGVELGTDGTINLSYDVSTGVIMLRSNMLGGAQIGGFSGPYYTFGYLPATEDPSEFTEISNAGTPILWNVTMDKNIIIPDFNIVDYTNPSSPKIIAKYTNVSINGYIPGEGGEGADISGEYTWYLQPVSMNGGTLDTVQVTVNVTPAEGGDDYNAAYVIEEVGDGNYLLGQKIPFTYNDVTKEATFDGVQFLVEQISEDVWVWFSPFLFSTMTELMPNIGIPLTRENGWDFSPNRGLGFFTSSSETDLNAQTTYKAYYILNAPAVGNGKYEEYGKEEEGDYPSLSSLAGKYNMTADVTFETGYNNAYITKYFPSSLTFTIDGSSIDGFVGQISSIGFEYSQATGTITLKGNLLGSSTDFDTYTTYNFGLANEAGEWTGQQAANGQSPWGDPILLDFQVDEKGNLTIPSFTIVNYTYMKTGGPVMVRYNNVKVTREGVEPEPDPVITYVLAGPIFLEGQPQQAEMTVEDNIATITATVQKQVYSIQKLSDGEVATVYGPAGTDVVTTALGTAYQAVEGATAQWVFGGDQIPGASRELTFSFDLTTLELTVTGEELPEPVEYPALEDLAGEYTFTASSFELGTGTFPLGDLKGTFNFTIATSGTDGVSISDFLYPESTQAMTAGTPVPAKYNQETGQITWTYPYLKNISVYYGLAPEGNWTGLMGNAATPFVMQVNPDGTITIPTFEFCAVSGATKNSVWATYGEATAAPYVEPVEYPALEDLAGEYTFTASSFELGTGTFPLGDLKGTFNFTIATSGTDGVSISDFLYPESTQAMTAGTPVPAKYNQETGQITWTYPYLKNISVYYGLAPEGNWTGLMGNAATPFVMQVNPDGTITIPTFEFCAVSGATKNSVWATYGEATAAPAQEVLSYPTIEELAAAGEFNYKASSFEKVADGNVSFSDEFTFTILQDNGQFNAKVENFIISNTSVYAAYNEEDGTLTFRYPYISNAGMYYGLAPNGEWGGLMGNTMIPFVLQVNPDMTITVPAFDFGQAITSNKESLQTLYAHYGLTTATPANGGGSGDEPGEEEDHELNGVWRFTEVDHYTVSKPETVTAEYKATVSGNVITFEEVADNGGEGTYHIIGTLTNPTTITFTKQAVSGGLYALYQVPFNNGTEDNNDIEALNSESFSAIVNNVDGQYSLEFPAGVGFRYANFDTAGTQQTDWMAAFDLKSAVKTADFVPEIVISNPLGMYFEVGYDYASINYDVQLAHLSISSVASWKANITQIVKDGEGEEVQQPLEAESTVEVVEGVATINITGLAPSKYDLRISISALNGLGEVIATSNEKALSIETGAVIGTIMAPKGSVDGGTITATVRAPYVSGMPEDVVYKMKFVNGVVADDEEVYEGEDQNVWYAEAELVDGYATAVLEDLADATYKFTVYLQAYVDDELIAQSENGLGLPDLTTSGVELIGVDGADVRYFNLQGVEISNPATGVYIRVEGNKASKVIVK